MNNPWMRLGNPENDIYRAIKQQGVLGEALRSVDWTTSGPAKRVKDEVTARTREAFHPLWYTLREHD